MSELKERIEGIAKANAADIVGFAPADRFDKNDPIFKIMPEVKTVVGMAFRILRGSCRGVEEGSTYYQYTTMAIETLEETIMPMAQLQVAMALEEEGCFALPQRRHQLIMAEENSTNPEMNFPAIYRGKEQETQMNFPLAAVKCGLGELGLHGAVLSDRFGPLMRYCFILTDAEIEGTRIPAPHLCDKCGKCIAACPGKAINERGEIDAWRCAVYYSGANGTKNPFMPKDAYDIFEDRMQIIAGEAEITPEKARRILSETYFYPSVRHAYRASICGRACDVECYIHLEEKGVLTEKFKAPFRKREPWRYDLKDYE